MARQIAQSIKCLPHQREDPSSILNSHVKMTGMEGNTYKPFTGESRDKRIQRLAFQAASPN